MIAAAVNPTLGSLAGWISLASVLAVIVLVFRVGTWKGKTDATVKTLTKNVDAFGEALEKIKEQVGLILGRLGNPIATSVSPLRLTEFGESLSAALDAGSWASRLVRRVQKHVDGMAEYEIQQYCFDYVKRFTCTDDELALLKKVAYDNGLEEEKVRRVLAIELRDQLLAAKGLEPPE